MTHCTRLETVCRALHESESYYVKITNKLFSSIFSSAKNKLHWFTIVNFFQLQYPIKIQSKPQPIFPLNIMSGVNHATFKWVNVFEQCCLPVRKWWILWFLIHGCLKIQSSLSLYMQILIIIYSTSGINAL